MTSSHDVIDLGFASSILYKHSDCSENKLNGFYGKSKFKNSKKSIGAFEKHADDVTSGSLIFPKISEVVFN